jgi:DNA repair photolyase
MSASEKQLDIPPPAPPSAPHGLGLRPLKGRGASFNPPNRFDRQRREAVDDGWADPGWSDGGGTEWQPPALRTTVEPDASRTIIALNRSPDLPFDRSINPYRGCEHGCVYCFARPSHAWLGLSPGLDFESRLFLKPDAAALLEAALRAPGYVCRPIAMGTNTDPYQPIERTKRVTRQVLDVLARFEHPVSIVTKSALVCRDLDILAPMAAKRLAKVGVSVTTLDKDLARRLEPRAAAPARRLAAIRALSEAGVPVVVMVAPVIPAINDGEIEAILEAARDAGARYASHIPLRLPHEVKELFVAWLDEHRPLAKKRALALIRSMRGGRLNDPEFGSRMLGSGPYAEMIRSRFVVACRRLGLERDGWALDTGRFKPPPAPGEQLSLL